MSHPDFVPHSVKRRCTSDEAYSSTTSTSTSNSSASIVIKTKSFKQTSDIANTIIEEEREGEQREGERAGGLESLDQSTSPFAKDSQTPMYEYRATYVVHVQVYIHIYIHV